MARRSGRSSRSKRAALPLFPFLLAPPRKRRTAARATKAAPLGLPVPGPARRTGAPRTNPARPGSGRWLRASHSGPAGSRSYDVYLPAGHRRSTPVPLVMLLHGCNQNPEEFVAATRFAALADRNGFVIAAPRQTRGHQAGGCWRWYESAHQSRGAGEPAILAGIAAEMTAERSRWRIDPSRVHAAGISAGGAMALILAATYPDVFAAVGVHSAPAYRSATNGLQALAAMRGDGAVVRPLPGARMAPLVVFQGTADAVVHGRSGPLLAEQWLAYDAARSSGPQDPLRITRSRAGAPRRAGGRRFTVTRWYTARGRKQLEHWQVEALAHAWSGGLAGGSYSDPRGPRASTAMWQFFAAHSL
ncbi:extracellular catalytic domain type 1 short-chain-length polyhydroxyalkanoate depolymerase [Modestobacter marinus]|uniref:extracellular catalytic domain type 1 short-chain-length polyhydroxyalkanoate depolymerase n=1 Tax=Modestobacter marinus TaxID=477641 RepID=UPI001C9705E2|nr:PHB depolymerase family esterase [Modestobacter marinus]